MTGDNWYVLTGGPATGKTTLIEELAKGGFVVVPESARSHIESELAKGKTIAEIRGDEVAFQRALFSPKLAAHENLPTDAPVFFDRGMHDSEAYLRVQGVARDPELAELLSRISYKKVFLLESLPYESDGVRTETRAEADAIQELLGEVYMEAGIPVVHVPLIPVAERVTFILNNL